MEGQGRRGCILMDVHARKLSHLICSFKLALAHCQGWNPGVYSNLKLHIKLCSNLDSLLAQTPH